MNTAVPSLSGIEEVVHEPSSIYSEISKSRLKDAVTYYISLLLENNFIASEASRKIEREAMLMGEELYERTLQMLDEKILCTDEELIDFEEDSQQMNFESVKEEPDYEDESDEYTPECKKSSVERIPLEYKIKVVNLAKLHPKWNLKTLQKKGSSRLHRMDDLSR